ncbi:hypothetical protein [Sphingobacterium yanglingense]|uniref:Secreted protein n=1 Tax=Sphingobacterium yanglingense TaxID=1437280 RepID=A0A4V3DCV0_9SPHI|nr:hypothetical protein [Sphingobacterium yanglingense]TDQ73823.1 hypothetical protein CLV99_4260 [Sphingobacterium yanglingense]
MKKIKIAFTAIACSAIIGTSIAGALPFAPGDHYPDATSNTPITGQKGVNWDCNEAFPEQTCAYLQVSETERVPISGLFYLK